MSDDNCEYKYSLYKLTWAMQMALINRNTVFVSHTQHYAVTLPVFCNVEKLWCDGNIPIAVQCGAEHRSHEYIWSNCLNITLFHWLLYLIYFNFISVIERLSLAAPPTPPYRQLEVTNCMLWYATSCVVTLYTVYFNLASCQVCTACNTGLHLTQ